MESDAGISGSNTRMIKAQLNENTAIYVEAKTIQGEQDIGAITATFQQVTKAIEDFALSLTKAWEKAKPRRASVEFSLDFAYDSGEVLAMFVQGSASGGVKVTLEWGEPAEQAKAGGD